MLSEFLTTNAFHIMIVFVRIGSGIMIMPGFSGRITTMRARLAFAMLVSLVILPVVQPGLPDLPPTVPGLALLIISEAIIGIFFSFVLQVLLTAVTLAGTLIGYNAGLTNAFVVDPVSEQQGFVLTNFLSNLALMLIFAANIHHLMLRGLVDTYTLFQPGAPLPWDDFANFLSQTLAASFTMGLQLAAPVMAIILTLYAGLGLLSRLMPQMQIFFVALPLQNLLGIGVAMTALSGVMLLFLDYFEAGIGSFIAGG